LSVTETTARLRVSPIALPSRQRFHSDRKLRIPDVQFHFRNLGGAVLWILLGVGLDKDSNAISFAVARDCGGTDG
jgi:hypothetical protein